MLFPVGNEVHHAGTDLTHLSIHFTVCRSLQDIDRLAVAGVDVAAHFASR